MDGGIPTGNGGIGPIGGSNPTTPDLKTGNLNNNDPIVNNDFKQPLNNEAGFSGESDDFDIADDSSDELDIIDEEGSYDASDEVVGGQPKGLSAEDAKEAEAANQKKAMAKKLIKEVGKKAMEAYGVPPGASDMIADKVLEDERVNKALDKVSGNDKVQEKQEQAAAQEENPAAEEAPSDGDGGKDATDKGKGCLIFALIASVLAPLMLMFITMMIVVIVTLSPLEMALASLAKIGSTVVGLYERTINFITWNGWQTNEESFYTRVNDQYIKYNEKGVIIDVPLMMATLFHDQLSDKTMPQECAAGQENCLEITNKVDYAKLRDWVNDLSENMVKVVGKKYFCISTYYGQDHYYSYYGSPNYGYPNIKIPGVDISKLPPTTTTTKSFCGYTDKSCVCPVKDTEPDEYKKETEDLYALKSDEDYKLWLKEKFVEKLLVYRGYTIPTDKLEKDQLFDDAIKNIYLVRDQYLSFMEKLKPIEGTYGYSIPDAGEAGELREDVILSLYNPIGDTQACRQNSCYGYYTANKKSDFYCKSHNGIDIAKTEDTMELYSIADGRIVGITNYSQNCDPTIESNRSNERCYGRSISIEYVIDINGEQVFIKAKYNHLESFANSNWPTLVSASKDVYVQKGEVIGYMGNTGLSTGPHLHFSLYNERNEKYNPEQLFAARSDCKMMVCNPVREYCDAQL